MKNKIQSSTSIIATTMQLQYILVIFALCDGFFVNASASGVALNLYKNKDVLATRTIPDLTALKFAHGDHKNEYFVKLLTAWDNLNFDRTFISRGKCFHTFITMSVSLCDAIQYWAWLISLNRLSFSMF